MSMMDAFVAKYMRILRIDGDLPIVRIRDNLGSRWLGSDAWSPRFPRTTTMEIQRRVLADPLTLERIVAHEMVHHRDALAMSERDIVLLKSGFRPDGHGSSFLQGAAMVNAVMGANFVTVMSDSDYSIAKNTKEFYVLIEPYDGTRFGYAWAARLSPEAVAVVAEKSAKGAKLVKTTDERWTSGKARIKRFGGMSIPKVGSDQERDLRLLYESVR